MLNLKNLNLEYKSTVLFGASALIMSLVTGVLMGIQWDTAVLRSFILAAVFAGIGFGACAVLKKHVPEVYAALVSLASRAGREASGSPAAAPDEDIKDDRVHVESASVSSEPSTMKAEPAFKDMDKEILDHYASSPSNAGVNTASGKLGKHVLQKEKLAKYEPQIMAKAVRTMMKKDE